MLVHKSKLYAIFKSAKKMKWNTLLERPGADKVTRHLKGPDNENFIVWFCEDKMVFFGEITKANDGYKITSMMGKELKRIRACWWHDDRMFVVTTNGDFVSLNPRNLMKEEEKFETGNLSILTTSAVCSFVMGNVERDCIVTADQYYRVRVWDKENLHKLYGSVSVKKNYVNKVCQISTNELICFYDDNTILLLGPEALFEGDSSSAIF